MSESSHPAPTTLPERLLRVDEVATILGVDPRTVKRLAAEGQLRRIVLGRRSTRYRLEDVRALIDRRTEVHNDNDLATPGRVEESAGQGRHVSE
ncbi:MAG: helix-turn-helix domain-containing protein [Actinomycetota bacterium]